MFLLNSRIFSFLQYFLLLNIKKLSLNYIIKILKRIFFTNNINYYSKVTNQLCRIPLYTLNFSIGLNLENQFWLAVRLSSTIIEYF